MNNWDYFRSVVIFGAAVYLVQNVFEISVSEAVLVVLFMVICVFHTIDIRDEIMKKIESNRRKRDSTNDG